MKSIYNAVTVALFFFAGLFLLGSHSDFGPQITTPYYLSVIKGQSADTAIVHKFGEASVGTTLTPVTESGFYRTPTTATALEFVSDSANDAAAGSGAQEITLIGLDANWEEVTQTLTTNGTTAVALSTNLTRLYRWYVSSSGTYADQSNGSHAGTLTIRESGGGQTWSTIGISPFTEGQSQIGVYAIPKGKKGYLLSQFIVVDSNKTIDALFFRRCNADDITTPFDAMRLLNKYIGIDGPVVLLPKSPAGPLEGPCDVGFMAKVDTGTGDISVDFEVMIQDS